MATLLKLMRSSWRGPGISRAIHRNIKGGRPTQTVSGPISRRNQLFDEEMKREREAVGRIEKIEVRYQGLPEALTLIMNRGLSTPYNCAQHLSEGICKRSALALVNDHTPWDMHRPLMDSCTLQLLSFTCKYPYIVNKAFWRTCSFMLGAALYNCFRDEAGLHLHSFPSPNVKSGSFVHDIVLPLHDWQPNERELHAISAEMVKLAGKDLKLERLDVNKEVAREMFHDSRYKCEHLSNIAMKNNGRVTLYRMGTHIDISRGPMVSSSRLLGRCTITAAHKVANEDEHNAFYRIQGVALPNDFILNHFAYGTLEKRAKKLNPARLPNEPFEEYIGTGNGNEKRIQVA